MLITETDILNTSLDKAGKTTAKEVDTQSKNNAQAIASRALHHQRRNLLGLYQWSFALKYAVLAMEVDYLNGNAYLLPADFIAFYKIIPNMYYAIRGRYLVLDDCYNHCNSANSGVNVLYVYDTEDINAFHPLFNEGWCNSIAAEVVRSVDGDMAKVQQLEAAANKAIESAKYADSVQTRQRVSPPSNNYIHQIRLRTSFSNGSLSRFKM